MSAKFVQSSPTKPSPIINALLTLLWNISFLPAKNPLCPLKKLLNKYPYSPLSSALGGAPGVCVFQLGSLRVSPHAEPLSRPSALPLVPAPCPHHSAGPRRPLHHPEPCWVTLQPPRHRSLLSAWLERRIED